MHPTNTPHKRRSLRLWLSVAICIATLALGTATVGAGPAEGCPTRPEPVKPGETISVISRQPGMPSFSDLKAWNSGRADLPDINNLPVGTLICVGPTPATPATTMAAVPPATEAAAAPVAASGTCVDVPTGMTLYRLAGGSKQVMQAIIDLNSLNSDQLRDDMCLLMPGAAPAPTTTVAPVATTAAPPTTAAGPAETTTTAAYVTQSAPAQTQESSGDEQGFPCGILVKEKPLPGIYERFSDFRVCPGHLAVHVARELGYASTDQLIAEAPEGSFEPGVIITMATEGNGKGKLIKVNFDAPSLFSRPQSEEPDAPLATVHVFPGSSDARTVGWARDMGYNLQATHGEIRQPAVSLLGQLIAYLRSNLEMYNYDTGTPAGLGAIVYRMTNQGYTLEAILDAGERWIVDQLDYDRRMALVEGLPPEAKDSVLAGWEHGDNIGRIDWAYFGNVWHDEFDPNIDEGDPLYEQKFAEAMFQWRVFVGQVLIPFYDPNRGKGLDTDTPPASPPPALSAEVADPQPVNKCTKNPNVAATCDPYGGFIQDTGCNGGPDFSCEAKDPAPASRCDLQFGTPMCYSEKPAPGYCGTKDGVFATCTVPLPIPLGPCKGYVQVMCSDRPTPPMPIFQPTDMWMVSHAPSS